MIICGLKKLASISRVKININMYNTRNPKGVILIICIIYVIITFSVFNINNFNKCYFNEIHSKKKLLK